MAAVEERNARYEAVVVSHKVADGGFISRPTQTANNPQKNQNDMAAPSALRDFGVQVCNVHVRTRFENYIRYFGVFFYFHFYYFVERWILVRTMSWL